MFIRVHLWLSSSAFTMSQNVYERFAERVAEHPGYVIRAAAPPPDFADFAWMAGDWD